MLHCTRVVASRTFFRPSVTSRSLGTLSSGNVDTSGIPIVDFANFGSLSFEKRRETARQVVDGFKSMGFVYLGNHGISENVVREAFQRVRGPVTRRFYRSMEYVQSDEFFQLPLEKKVSMRLCVATRGLWLKRARVLGRF